MYQAIATLQPNYKNILPSTSTIEAIISKRKPVLEYPLEGSLQKALGGENYVKTCLRTELGHHIGNSHLNSCQPNYIKSVLNYIRSCDRNEERRLPNCLAKEFGNTIFRGI